MFSLIKTIYKLIKFFFIKLPTIIMILKLLWKYLYKAILFIWLIIFVIIKKRK
jgi:hypothetical protein